MNYVLFLEIIIGIILIVIFILSLKVYSASKKNKRIGYYSLDPIKDDDISFSDKIVSKYNNFIVYMRKYISKSVFLKNSAKRYDKYIKYNDRDRIKNIDYISNKIVISFSTDKVVSNTNADKVVDNKYYWYINKDNYLNSDIKIVFDKEANQDRELLTEDRYITWSGLKYILYILLIFVLIAVVVIYEKVKNSNK